MPAPSDSPLPSHPSAGLPRGQAIGLAVILAIIWGTAYTMVGVAVDYLPPIWIVAIRCIIGAALVTAYMFAKGRRFPPLRDKSWPIYSLLGVIGMVIPFWLLSVGQKTVDSGLTAIIVGAMPILTIILAHFFAHEPMSWRKMLGFVIGFFGIVLLFLPENLSLELVADWKAQLLIVLAALFYAITTVAAKRAPELSSIVGASIMLISAAVSATASAALTTPLPPAPPIAWIMVLGLAIGSTALGNIIYLYYVKMAGPSALAKVNYFPPIVSVIAGVWFLNEPFSWKAFLALGIIFIGVAITREKAS